MNIYEQCLAVPDTHTNLIIGGWNEVMGNLDVDHGMTQKMFPHILQIWNCKLGPVNYEMIETISKLENNGQVQRRSNEQFMLFQKRMDGSFWPKIKFT